MSITKKKKEDEYSKQSKYLNRLKNRGIKRVTINIAEKNYKRLKSIAAQGNITQGEVIDRLLEEINVNAAALGTASFDVDKTVVDRFRFEDFELSELAIETISTVLGYTRQDIRDEELQEKPDLKKLASLKDQQRYMLNEQDQIYSGNKIVIKHCIEKYSPEITKRMKETHESLKQRGFI